MNIPIYRAKKIDSDEFVEGDLIHDYFDSCRLTDDETLEYYISALGEGSEQIDPNTLAIHFPNMIDKNSKKIFASLSEDGVGGDIMRFEYASKYDVDSVAMYDIEDCMFGLSRLDLNSVYIKGRAFNEYEVIEINKGENNE